MREKLKKIVKLYFKALKHDIQGYSNAKGDKQQ
jgi:hypothetical protein